LELSDPLTLPDGAVPGAEVLTELPGELAVLCFDLLRIVHAFAVDGGDGGWYDPALLSSWEEALLVGDLEGGLRAPVCVALRQLVDPAATDVGVLSKACLLISEWALERKAELTSLAFTRAAALVWPSNPRLAYLAGRRYGSALLYRDADLWLRRAARIALWYEDAETYAHALTSLGMLHYRQGGYPKARAFLDRAAKIARRNSLRTLEGEIHHDRFTVAFVSGEQAGVEQYARNAFERYLPSHHRLPALAYDVAYYWLTIGRVAPAFDVFTRLEPLFPEPRHKFQVLSAAARAAGALRDRAAFQRLWGEASVVALSLAADDTLPAALTDLAYGAAHLGDWAHAESALGRALDLATASGLCEERIKAEDGLAAVRRGENPDTITVLHHAGTGDRRADDLATRFARHFAGQS
jgi:tetratricopeptide (TPR) repeat protein